MDNRVYRMDRRAEGRTAGRPDDLIEHPSVAGRHFLQSSKKTKTHGLIPLGFNGLTAFSAASVFATADVGGARGSELRSVIDMEL